MRSIILLTGIFFLSISLRAQNTIKATELLNNEKNKEQIFNAIVADPELKSEMMKFLLHNAEKDSSTCKMMGEMMMDNNHMMDNDV